MAVKLVWVYLPLKQSLMSALTGNPPLRSTPNGPSSMELLSIIRPSWCAETVIPLPKCATISRSVW